MNYIVDVYSASKYSMCEATLCFVLSAANTTLYPYLAVHLQSLGFGADKAGVLLAITPLVAIMGPPISGAFADKLGNFKVCMADSGDDVSR